MALRPCRALVILALAAARLAQPGSAGGEPPAKAPGRLAGVPRSARERANPYEGRSQAVAAGRKLFLLHCAECHGADARGGDKAPALDSDEVQQATSGELFWFVTNGNLRIGMPAWSALPEARRWQIIAYLKTLRASPPAR